MMLLDNISWNIFQHTGWNNFSNWFLVGIENRPCVVPTKARLVDCLTHSHLNEEVIEEIPHKKPTLVKADSHWLSANNQIAQTDPTGTNYYYKLL